MRQLTFKTYLEFYLRDVSGEATVNIHRLVRLSKDNIRIIDPLILYAVVSNKKHILAKYIDSNKTSLLKELNFNNFLDDKFSDFSFSKIWKSYQRKINVSKANDDIKKRARDNLQNLF